MQTISKPQYRHLKSFLITIIAESAALFLHIVFLGLFYYYDVPPLYYFNYASIALFALLLYLTIKKGLIILSMILVSIEVIVHQTLAVILLGWDFGFQYYLLAVPGFVLLGDFKRQSVPVSFAVLCFVDLLWLYFAGRYCAVPHYQMPDAVQSVLYLLNLASLFILMTVFDAVFARTSNKYEDLLLRTHDQLYVAATTDALTKLANRQKTIDLIERENIRARRNGKPYVLAIADIDDFKTINDTYGHDVGDVVLVSVAETMRRTMRSQDIVGRWGGEEFIIVLTETDLSGARIALERLRGKISGTTIFANETALNITMTFGAAASQGANTLDELVKMADTALYKGKRGNKNCIVLSDGDPGLPAGGPPGACAIPQSTH